MKKEEYELKKYIIPLMYVEVITIENGIAQSSFEYIPGNESGVIKVSDWSQEEDIPSIEGDSRW